MQAFAGNIQRNTDAAFVLTHLDTYIRVLGVYVGALAFNTANTVNNRIFNPLGTKHGVINKSGGTNKVDSNALLGGEMTLPGNIVTLLIQVICFVEHKTV